jgi:hypothetical protein
MNTKKNDLNEVITGEFLVGVLTGQGNDPAVKLYYDQEMANETGMARSRRETANREGKPLPARIIPPFFYYREWLQNSGLSEEDRPVYTVSSAVVLGGLELKRGIQVNRCRFTELVSINNLASPFDVSFIECIFEKGIEVTASKMESFSIVNTMTGTVDLKIKNSSIEHLILVGNSIVNPTIDGLKAGQVKWDTDKI